MKDILIGSANPYKQQRLVQMVSSMFNPVTKRDILPVEEYGKTFKEVAENKACDYSKKYNTLVISTDGGAVIPSLSTWEPIKTRRFGSTDKKRIETLLKRMEGIANRTVEWHEAIAIAERGHLIFSATAKAMDGVISDSFNPQKYQEGIWLCSITDFPQFGNKNYFDLNPTERAQTEDSWQKLEIELERFFHSQT